MSRLSTTLALAFLGCLPIVACALWSARSTARLELQDHPSLSTVIGVSAPAVMRAAEH